MTHSAEHRCSRNQSSYENARSVGELTHLLYEKHRTGVLKLEKKRKSAWQFDSPDFLATYLGHTGHFLEAKICT